MPDTLAHPSMRPNLLIVSAIHAWTCPCFVMSHAIAITRSSAPGHSVRTSAWALAIPLGDELDMETVAPRRTRYLTVARPVPRLPPATVMTLPLKGVSVGSRMPIATVCWEFEETIRGEKRAVSRML